MKKCLLFLLFLLVQITQQATFAQAKINAPTPPNVNSSKSERWYPVCQGINATSPAFIDSKGQVKLAFDSTYKLAIKDDIDANIFEGEYMLIKKEKDGKEEYYSTDRKGNLKPFPTDIGVVTISNNFIIVKHEWKGMAIWKTDLTPLTPFKYFNIKPYSEGLATARVTLKGSFNLIDERGVETLPEDRYAGYSKDSRGKDHFAFDNSVSEGLTNYTGNGKFGIMGKKGEIKTAPIFDELRSFHNGLAYVRKGDTTGYVNKNGKFVLPFKGSKRYFSDFSCGLALVGMSDPQAWYFINTSGNMAFPRKYYAAESFSNGYAVVTNDKSLRKKQIIDIHGNVVYEGFFENAWFLPDVIVITTESSFAGYDICTNGYKYLDYNFHTIWQPPVDKKIITNLLALPENEYPQVRYATLGYMDWHIPLKDVDAFLNKANLINLKLIVTDRPLIFPAAILKMSNLEELDLSFNDLSEIPEDIGKLDHLKTLKIDQTKINHLPKSLYKLKQLQTLSVVNTKLTIEEIMKFKQSRPEVKVIVKD